jgi:hypothetical protein
MVASAQEGGYTEVSGTSFATALVSGLLVNYLLTSDNDEKLTSDVVDLGRSGTDPVFGRGLLGKSLLLPSLAD